MSTQFDTITYTVPTWCLSAFINADFSGLEDGDIKSLNEFIEREGLFEDGHWSPPKDVDAEKYFSYWNDVTGLCDEVVDVKWVKVKN